MDKRLKINVLLLLLLFLNTPANVHPAKELRLVRLGVYHLVCQVQKARWQPGFQQHQRLARRCHRENLVPCNFTRCLLAQCTSWREDLRRSL